MGTQITSYDRCAGLLFRAAACYIQHGPNSSHSLVADPVLEPPVKWRTDFHPIRVGEPRERPDFTQSGEQVRTVELPRVHAE